MSNPAGLFHAFHTFIDLTDGEHIKELEDCLIEKGLVLPSTLEERGSAAERLFKVVEECKILFDKQDTSPQDLDNFIYSIVSLFRVIETKEDLMKLLNDLCTSLLTGTTPTNARHKLRLLDLLFNQFDVKSVLVSVIFWHRLEIGVKYQLGSHIDLNLEKLKVWMDSWQLSLEERRKAYKMLWELYRSTKRRNISCQALTELVSTSTGATEDVNLVRELVVMALGDPDRYIFNELLEIEAVKLQKTQKFYQLLEIFTSGRYESFLKFCQLHSGYLEELGLSYEACEHKIKVLTLLSLSEDSSEIPFSQGLSELQTDINSFEQLIIDAIRYKLLNARIDHVNQKVVVTNCVRRTFGSNEWKLLHDTLSSWRQNISLFRSNLKALQLPQTAQQSSSTSVQ